MPPFGTNVLERSEDLHTWQEIQRSADTYLFVPRNIGLNRSNYSRDDFYAACRMADFWIDLERLPRGEVAALAALPGIDEVQPRLCFPATVDLEDCPQPINGLVLSAAVGPPLMAGTSGPAASGGLTINTMLLRHGSGFSSPGWSAP